MTSLKSLALLSLVTGGVTLAPFAGAQDRGDRDRVQLGACAIAGGTMLSARAAAAFALSINNDSLYIEGIIIARAQPGWRGFGGTRRQLVQPVRSGAPKHLSGATIDTLFLQFDTKARVAWVHTTRVPLDTNNVVLVDRADTRGGPPAVVGTTKVSSPVPFKWNCRDKNFPDQLKETLTKTVLISPIILEFIGPVDRVQQ